MTYETITFQVQDHVAYITLNRPDVANGFNIAMGKDLMHAAIRCGEDPGIRAILMTGAGKMFSSGGDLKYFYDFGDNLGIALKELTVYCHAAVSRFMRMPKPVVTAVNGAAAGIGMSFALCGDLIIAAESAIFMSAYTAAGLSPDGGMTHFLPRMIGLARTKEMLLTNRRLNAKEALEWGIVTKIVPDDELGKEAEALAKKLATGPTLSFGSVKRLLGQSFTETLESQMEHEALGIVDMTKTKDGKEGITAFIEKRRPNFTGSL
jgi:2-(1,2-epoxy-1,2-dihydrophenyl)acetyl-CoA isomerase